VFETGDVTESFRHARRARALLEPIAAKVPLDLELRLELSRVYDLLGVLSVEAGNVQDALELHRADLRRLEAAPDSERQTPRMRRALSVAHQHLGDAQAQAGELAAALESNRRGLALRAALVAEFPENAEYRRILMVSYYWEAEILAEMGRTREALARYRRNYATVSALAAADPKNEQYRSGMAFDLMAFDLSRIGDMLVRLGAREQALGDYRRALALREKELKADSANQWKRLSVIESHARICKTLVSLGRSAAPAACAETASLMNATTVEPTNAGTRGYIAGAYSDLGEVYDSLAVSRATPAADRRMHRRAARDMYQRSFDIWSDMTARGIVVPADTGRLGAAARAVARSEAALRTGVESAARTGQRDAP
jgi:tetratricopeptide (TPR) repeat protein